jgi:serine/threonine protein kinase
VPSGHNDNSFNDQPKQDSLAYGSVISHYKIINLIGRGAMGEVYQAEDLKLERLVALKFLPRWLSQDAVARNGLIQEARAASKLNHSNIMAIYAMEECQGRDFIVMEYIDGASLRELICRGEASVKNIVELGLQICKGLDAAHGEKIIHGDIKPQNILLNSKDVIKICDFGLARFRGSSDFLKAGSTAGTVAYMSPEQVEGQEIDTRSDIFSTGVVLYEMLSGYRPFQGEYEAALTYSIVNDNPKPLSDYRTDLPAKLEGIIGKSLAKDPIKRYQDISEMILELESLFQTEETVEKIKPFYITKSKLFFFGIAFFIVTTVILLFFLIPRTPSTASSSEKLIVIPFENLGSSDDENFAEGFADLVTTELAQIRGLGVISRSTANHYKGSNKTVQEIGNEVRADYILEGSVMLEKTVQPSRVRINCQLIKVANDTHIWAQAYERDITDIFATQSEIAQNVTAKLNLTLIESQRQLQNIAPTKDEDASIFYVQGLGYFGKTWSERDLRIAIQMYEKAIMHDSSFALAYAMLSKAHSVMYGEYYDRSPERIALARQTAEKALKISPNLPEAHLALGTYYYIILETDQAMSEYRIMEKSQPNNSDLLGSIAGLLRRKGDFHGALSYYISAFKYDPRSQLRAFDIALTFSMLREYPESENYLNQAAALAPDWPLPYMYKAWLQIFWKGDIEHARQILSEAARITDLSKTEYYEYYWWLSRIVDRDYSETLRKITLGPDSASYYLSKGRIYHLLNDASLERAYFDSALVFLENKVKAQPYDPRFHSQIGFAYAGLNEYDKAIPEGKTAVEMLPFEKDAYNAQFLLANLAEIYVMAGNKKAALEQLDVLLSHPGFTSIPYVKVDPIWAPLLSEPGFEKLTSRQNN